MVDATAIRAAMLVTADGELLGATASTPEHLGTLIADIAVEYQRLGDELSGLAGSAGVSSAMTPSLMHRDDHPHSQHQPMHGASPNSADGVQSPKQKISHLQCLLLELEQGLVGVSSCVGVDCLVIAIAHADAPPGLLKTRLQAVTEYVQEALSPLAAQEMQYR